MNIRYQALQNYQYNYKQFRSVLRVNENTLRTWLKRFLTDVGQKKPSGRMLYSGVDCIRTAIFVHLSNRLLINPSLSAEFCKTALKRIHELLLLTDAEISKVFGNPTFIVFDELEDINGRNTAPLYFKHKSQKEFSEKYLTGWAQPFIVVPIDSIFFSIRDKLVSMALLEQLLPERTTIDL